MDDANGLREGHGRNWKNSEQKNIVCSYVPYIGIREGRNDTNTRHRGSRDRASQVTDAVCDIAEQRIAVVVVLHMFRKLQRSVHRGQSRHHSAENQNQNQNQRFQLLEPVVPT